MSIDTEKQHSTSTMPASDISGTGEVSEELLQRFLEAGVHYGRKKTVTQTLMKPYVLDSNKNIEIFDVGKTKQVLEAAAERFRHMIQEKKSILFLGVQPAAQEEVQEIAQILQMFYLNHRWVGGFLTNFATIQSRLLYYKDLLAKQESGQLAQYPPHDRQRLLRELGKLDKTYRGVKDMQRLPDAIFIVDLNYKAHRTAHREARRKNIPIIAICGSDNRPVGVTIVIPGNDKAPRSIRFMLEYLLQRLQDAKEEQPVEQGVHSTQEVEANAKS